MNLYQAGYFRQGRQGNNAGWNIVSPSDGMSMIAKNGFKGIAANLTELKGSYEMPVEGTGIFRYERFLYLLNINYAAKGEDDRGVSFTHGYCFNNADYYELCHAPEKLFALREDCFLKEYDDSVEEYPIRQQLAHGEMNFDALMNKYQLSKEQYRMLILAAISAIEGFTDPLCIQTTEAFENMRQVYNEVMYLIMYGLPYHMRIKVTCFSYRCEMANIYFSRWTEGNNCFELETKNCNCDTRRLASYHFTKIYNPLNTDPRKDDLARNMILSGIAKFIDASVENPLLDVGCDQIEAGYLSLLKKNSELAITITPEEAQSLLITFLNSKITEHTQVDEYVALLLGVINDSDLEIGSEKVVRWLQKRYLTTSSHDYLVEYNRFTVADIVSTGGERGYRKIWSYYEMPGERYEALCESLQKENPEFYRDYYVNFYLEKVISGLEDVLDLVSDPSNNEEISSDEALAKQVMALWGKSLKGAFNSERSFEESKAIVELNKSITRAFPDAICGTSTSQFRTKKMEQAYEYLWKCFRLEQFDMELISEYEAYNVTAVAQGESEGARNADIVYELIRVVDGFGVKDDYRGFMAFLLSGKSKANKQLKRKVQIALREKYFEQNSVYGDIGANEFDITLTLFYDVLGNKFNVVKWAQYIYENDYEELLEARNIPSICEESYLLKRGRGKEKLLDALEQGLEYFKGSKDKEYKVIYQSLENYKNCLLGKKVKSAQEIAEQNDFLYGMHRLMIINLFVVTIGMVAMSIVRYTDYNLAMKLIICALLGGVFLMGVVLRILLCRGLDGLFEDIGVISRFKMIIYIVVAMLFIVLGVVTALISKLPVVAICVLISSSLAVVFTLLYIRRNED